MFHLRVLMASLTDLPVLEVVAPPDGLPLHTRGSAQEVRDGGGGPPPGQGGRAQGYLLEKEGMKYGKLLSNVKTKFLKTPNFAFVLLFFCSKLF